MGNSELDRWQTVNPLTGEVLKSYQFAQIGDVEKNLQHLQTQFLKWRKLSLSDRQKKLSEIIDRLEQNKDELALLITTEMGKPLSWAQAEIDKCILVGRHYSTTDLHVLKPVAVETKTYSKAFITREPCGVLLSIMPWNFPFWQALRFIIPVVVAGNVVLLKHSEICPLSAQWIERLFCDNDFQLVRQSIFSHQLTKQVISHPLIRGVSITGSTRAGQIISEICGSVMKKYMLELGGSDAYVVLANADIAQAAKVIALARLGNCGQVCIAAKRALVDIKILPQFVEALKSEFQKYEFGDPFVLTTQLGPLAHPRFKDIYNEQVKELSQESEILFHQKNSLAQPQNAYVDSYILHYKGSIQDLHEVEVFGPCLILQTFTSQEEAIHLANSTVYGLGSAIFTRDLKTASEIAQQIEVGHVAINSQVKSDSDLPFGGTKKSGIGRELGDAGLIEFTITKVISYG